MKALTRDLQKEFVLNFIRENKSVSIPMLAEELDCTMSWASTLLRELLKSELLVRGKVNSNYHYQICDTVNGGNYQMRIEGQTKINKDKIFDEKQYETFIEQELVKIQEFIDDKLKELDSLNAKRNKLLKLLAAIKD